VISLFAGIDLGGTTVDGRLRLGPLGAAGELGHQTVLPDGPLCGCGNRGCLEAVAFVATASSLCLTNPRMVAEAAEPRAKIPVGVQLWTLRRELAEDLPGTLRQVAEIGYVVVLRRFDGRLKRVHLKENAKPGSPFKNTELGRGTIDWDAVCTAAVAAGAEWFLVEQDCEGRPALESVRISHRFLREMGLV
jgi:hypothetical protein